MIKIKIIKEREMDTKQIYIFAGGAFVGKYVGIIPSMIISGVLLYVAEPTIFQVETVKNITELIVDLFVKK